MKILVVGGAGYIGSHTARALKARGHQAVIYDNLCTGFRELAEGFELVVGDMSDSAKVKQALRGVDAVMHFAAHAYVGESATNPRKYFHNNTIDAITLLDTVLDAGVDKFIFSSTCAVFGSPAKLPIAEDAVRSPLSPYGSSKLAFENALQAYGGAYNLRYVSFRYFNAAGADDSNEIGEMHSPETHLIPCVFEAIEGRRPALEIYGDDYPTPDGTCVRDYIHVSDLAEAHVLGVEHLEKGNSVELNLGTGRGHSVREVIDTIERVTGKKVPFRIAPRRPGDPPELVADPSRAQRLLNWKAVRSLEKIVQDAWNWEQKRQSELARA